MDNLQKMMNWQKEFTSQFPEMKNYKDLSLKDKSELTLMSISNTIEELIELQQEIPHRKFWSNKKDLGMSKMAKEEYIDVFHWVLTIALINDWDSNEIFKSFEKKREKNKKRLNNGLYEK